MTADEQTDREDCYICGSGNPDLLERHHIVPKRHGGSDEPANLVDLCPSCHRALETLYGQRFYKSLGIGPSEEIVEYVASYVALRIHEVEHDVIDALDELRHEVESEFGEEFTPDLDGGLRRAFQRHHRPNFSTNGADSEGDEAQKERIRNIKALINDIAEFHDEGAPIEEVLDLAEEAGMSRSKAEHEIEKLRRRGDVYEPQTDHLRAV